jgi:hypothetical protein
MGCPTYNKELKYDDAEGRMNYEAFCLLYDSISWLIKKFKIKRRKKMGTKKKKRNKSKNQGFFEKKNSIGIVLLVGVIILTIIAFVAPSNKKEETMKSVTLLSNAPSYASEGEFVKIYQVNVKRIGMIDSGFLYVRARKGNAPLDDKYDSIYINAQDVGGHLIRPKSLSIPYPIANTTEVLFPLNEIPVIPHVPYIPNTQDYNMANWVVLFNTEGTIRFYIALSTEDPNGMIDEVGIMYKCYEKSNCSLTIK